jgi:8-oxo-dGTP pyrophosphatase MutT (NUDIX family)
MSASNPWTRRGTRLVYDNPWITVREDEVIRPDGQPGIYGVVHFKHRAVGVLAVEEDGSIWLVGQYRYPLEAYSWEIPEGGCSETETPEAAAARELREETGLVAGRLERLGVMHLSNSVSDEWGVVFRATGLTSGSADPEGSERLDVKRVAFREAMAMLERGEITDSLSVMALLRESIDRSRGSEIQAGRTITLEPLSEKLAILRLEPSAEMPPWTAYCHGFLSVTRTEEELSIVAPARCIPAYVPADRGWVGLRAVGPLPLDETGILASLAGPLARAGIPLFGIATYDTDYLLVRDVDLERASGALRDAGHVVIQGR